MSGTAYPEDDIKPVCGGATPENNYCIADKLADADEHLNKLYKGMLKKLAASSKAADSDRERDEVNNRRQVLVEAERAWIGFKDAQCNSEANWLGQGTGTTAVHLSCELELTELRLRELQSLDNYGY